jgi:hypothetical protein
MKEVTLMFPDSHSLLAFVLTEKNKGLDIKTFELKASGLLSEEQIVTACKKYKAVLQKKLGNAS